MKIKLSTTQKHNLNFLRVFLVSLILMVSARFLVASIQASPEENVKKEIVECVPDTPQLERS